MPFDRVAPDTPPRTLGPLDALRPPHFDTRPARLGQIVERPTSGEGGDDGDPEEGGVTMKAGDRSAPAIRR